MSALAHVLTPFDSANVRMVMIDGEPWWVGIDVTAALGISKPHQSLGALEEYQFTTYAIGSERGPRQMIIINESGFYRLLFRSTKPIAAKFNRWLTCEVLPSIRKHGCYPPPPPAPLVALPPPDTETPKDGEAKPHGLRFQEERLRYEAEHKIELAKTAYFTANKIIAIENGTTGLKKLEKPPFLLGMTYAGFDVNYVLRGERIMTTAERTQRDAYRRATPDQRTALLAAARAIPIPLPPPRDEDDD